MEVPRSMTWKEFRGSLNNMTGKKIMYIDEEGTELPINTDAEFQEAMRLAKSHGNRVRFILTKNNSDEGRRSARQNSKAKEKNPVKDSKHLKGVTNDAEPKVAKEVELKSAKEPVYANDAAPEWFLTFMKKFKKDLLADVNNAINENLRKTFKKEAKLYDERLAKDYEWEMANHDMNGVGTQHYYRSDGGYKTPTYFVSTQPAPVSSRIRIRCADNSYMGPMRDDKGFEKSVSIGKIRPAFLDKRQMPETWLNLSTVVRDDVMMPKGKLCSKVYVTYAHDFGPIKPTKSALFTSKVSLKKLEVFQPYALWFLLGNNGIVPWSNNAYVKCFYNPDEFELEDNVIDLPSLETGVGANVVFEVIPLKVGSFSFTCAIMDCGVEIAERILCRFEVVNEEGVKVVKPPAFKPTRTPTLKREMQQPCDHYNEEFVKTQRKIKENIKTIMKRLDDIDVLNSDSKADSKKKEDDSVKVGQKKNRKKRKEGTTIELRTGVFDLLQNLEIIREYEEGKPKDEEKENVKETLVGAEDKKEAKGNKKDKHDENGKKKIQVEIEDCDEKEESKKGDAETDRRDSDSELSVIMGSEEDDNFIVLSMPSRTPTPETEVKELESDKDKKKVQNKENGKEKEKEKEKDKDKDKGKDKDATQKESHREEKKTTFESNTFDPWNEKKRPAFNGHFSFVDGKSPFSHFCEEIFNDENCQKFKYNFGHSSKMGKQQFHFCDALGAAQEMFSNMTGPEIHVTASATSLRPPGNGKPMSSDMATGSKVVYVVDKGGKCVPVMGEDDEEEEMQQEGGETKKRQESAEAKEKYKESQGEASDGTPKDSSTGSEQTKEKVDQRNLSNLLLYNAASDAVKTATSVFNNIHFAFQKGVNKKIKVGTIGMKPIKMMQALDILEDMGFDDKIRNRQLLMIHNLNIDRVVEDLLDKTPSLGDNPPRGVFMTKQGVYGRF